MLGRVASAPPQIPGLTGWRALARGGFATVWEAKQESLNRLVAVKVDQRRLDHETEQRRFLREAGAAGRLSGHPGIVTVHDAGILADDRPYLIMELCPGGSLTRWLTADPRPDQRKVRDVGVRVADALAAAHVRGVLHRDVKPANILIDAYDNPGLADFGLAALPDPGMELSESIDAITPAYAPPEVFKRLPPTEYGDVYSLAATLYALLAGHPPHAAEAVESTPPSPAEWLTRQRDPVKPIPDVHPEFMKLLLSAMVDEPADRPTAAQFRDRLSELDFAPAPAAPIPSERSRTLNWADPEVPSRPTEGRRPEHRRSLIALAAVLVVLIIALIITVVSLRSRAAQPPSSAPSVTAVTRASEPVSPSATPVVVPDGSVDCSSQLGAQTYCFTQSECWAGIIAVGDVPSVATPVACEGKHVHQTFALGILDVGIRRQSQLERLSQVRKSCRVSTVNAMLSPRDRRSDWEVLAIGPQIPEEDFYRCIFGRGDASAPYRLRALR